MSETPRTDAVWELFATDTILEPDVEFSTLARQLERELAAANTEIEEKRKDVVWLATEKAKLENYVMLLEEWGDYMRSHSNNEWWCENWDKAKEAKP